MKKHIFIIMAILILIPAYSNAQSDSEYAKDEKAIRQVMKDISNAWSAGDGKKFADNFTDDVDFTIWNGMYINGREANIKGHQQTFDTFYKGTSLKAEIKKIRFLTDDVATVHLQSEMYRDGKRVEGVPMVVPLMVLKKENGKWRVAVFQNTPIIEREELVVGETAESKEEKQK